MADAQRHLRTLSRASRWVAGVESRGCASAGGWRLSATLLALPLFALGAQPAPTLQTVRFTAFSLQPVTDVAFVPRAKAAPVTLKFSPSARSPRYEYHGSMPLRFVDPVTQAVVAEAGIPPGMQHALLLFSPLESGPAGAGKLRYQVAVLDDGAARHGPGGLAIVNLSGLNLKGTLNERSLTLKAGLSPTYPVGKIAKLRLTTVVKQRTHQAYAGTANLGSNERALLILFPPFYKGSLEVQSRLLLDQPPANLAPRRK